MEIIPGNGLDKIQFGMLREDVKKILGEPDVIDKYPEDSGSQTEAWDFHESLISLNFDEDEQWRLSTIEIRNPEFMLKDSIKVGQSRLALINSLKNLNLGELEIEDAGSKEEPDHELIFCEAIETNFWLTHQMVSEIQWTPFLSEKGDYIWPVLG